ncbi:MAG: AAA family ATPase [Chitinophagaceae bacterium]
MELKEIQIKNFRSIKDEKISFNHNCLVLIGKNEAGKTKVLKAIASLFGLYEVSDRDKRKRIDNEKISEFLIWAVYILDSKDFKTVEERIIEKYEGVENIKFKSGISLEDYLKKVFYNINNKILIGDDEKPALVHWTFPNKKEIELESQLFITGTIISTTGTIKFDLDKIALEIVSTLYKESNFKCHYWQYSDSYLLPSSVDIDEFIATPSKFKAFENVFALCGRGDIKKEFQVAKSEDGDYSNLLEQVSKKVTTTFQRIWKDFKGTSIQLLPNGDEILIKVVDKAKYSFEDRSDGFKKFICILLMLSTESRSNKILEYDIILIDEPDQSLYPTSAQYLRDELLEIAKKSKVIYSTHSQYMIDSTCLDRHIVVEKADDITVLKKEDANAPYTTDELLRRAIGSSIFECLKPKNIIFEGYLDKELFNKYCKFHKVEKEFSNYGTVYLSGISGVETLVQILTLANKQFVIVADSDETSKNKRIDFERNFPEYKKSWLAYGDVCKNVSTMEDFSTVLHIEDQLKKNSYEYVYDPTKNANSNIEKAVNRDKELKQQFKNLLIETLKRECIVTEYVDYIQKLKEKLEAL